MTKPFDITKFRKSITKSIQGLGLGFSDPTDWISTGNFALNYLISGHILSLLIFNILCSQTILHTNV